MLSRVLTNQFRQVYRQSVFAVTALPTRQYRAGFMNPYKFDPTRVNEDLREEQSALPVWDRVFDHKKYMAHDGPLKLTTGIAYLDVDPFPRMKLMKLYYLTLQEHDELPEAYAYKFLSKELTKHRMKIVDENTSIRTIEEKISYGLIEELIVQAHNELKLMRLMKAWRPWEHMAMEDSQQKEFLQAFASFRQGHPYFSVFEEYESGRKDRKPRQGKK